jgi:uncharacterized protein (DUF427 family)
MPGSSDRIVPGPGQESVWDYPRPPRLERVPERLTVRFAGTIVADTSRGLRVLETSHPPVYYIPHADILPGCLEKSPGVSVCEFKGEASYVSLVGGGRRSERAGWTYARPVAAFDPIAGHVAFYASRVDEARVGDEIVVPQAGDFYGGWVTSRIVGPFKGGPGTRFW